MLNKIKEAFSKSQFLLSEFRRSEPLDLLQPYDGGAPATDPNALAPQKEASKPGQRPRLPIAESRAERLAALDQEDAKPRMLTPQHLAQVAWIAQSYNLRYQERSENKGFTLSGHVLGKNVKFERGSPSRAYINGMELRARCEAGLPPDTSFMVVNRNLKMDVHKAANSGFADSVMSHIDANMPEEVLWMTMFSEVEVSGVQERFMTDYCVLAEEAEHARILCTPELARLLCTWPRYSATRPFLLMVVRGRLYMRMRYSDDTFTLEHAIQTFNKACEIAISNAVRLAV